MVLAFAALETMDRGVFVGAASRERFVCFI